MTTHELSRYLRDGSDSNLQRRRAIVCLSLSAAATMGLMAAYQVGIIKRLPDPPLPRLNSEKVIGSGAAYGRFQTPDALLGLGSYAITAALAAAGGKNRAKSNPWLPLFAAAKVLLDVGNALRLTWNEGVKQKALCFYCLLATLCTLGMAPLVFPEAKQAISQLLGRSQHRNAIASQAREVVSQLTRKIEYPWATMAGAGA